MVQPFLAALFLGLIPATGYTPVVQSDLAFVSIAPPAESIPVFGHMSASGVLVMDMESGQRVYGKQVSVQRSMASLTKLMTALIIVENHHLNEVVTIPEGVEMSIGNKAYLKPGEHFPLSDLLSALLIASANDAARTLALYHSGSIEKFAEEMNARAKSLGLKSTSFANPDGLDEITHHSTPQDIAWLTMYVLRHPEIAKRMATRGTEIVSAEGSSIPLIHTHALMHSNAAVVAGKTGTTDEAGECLVSIVEEDGKQYLVVILNSLQRYQDLRTILSALSLNAPKIANAQTRSPSTN